MSLEKIHDILNNVLQFIYLFNIPSNVFISTNNPTGVIIKNKFELMYEIHTNIIVKI
jgi:pantothenate kinase